MYIELTGTGGASTNLIVPANKKLYFIFNNTTGAVTVKVSGQTGVSVPQGKKMVLVSNGTDVVVAENYIADFGSNSATITNLTCTSLTLSNNPTFSGGTANGVLYLNGSKVATSGSALVFDGTNLGIGTASPSDKLHVVGLARINTGTYAAGYGLTFQAISETSRTYQMGMVTGGNFAIYDSAAAEQRVVLDTSGNLGIGTTSPGFKLDVQGSATDFVAFNGLNTNNNAGTITSSAIKFGFTSTVGTHYATLKITEDSANSNSGALTISLPNGGAETPLLALTSAGNLGIGTTNPYGYLSGTAKLVAYANANAQNSILVRNDSTGASASCAIALNASGNSWGIECGSSAKNSNALTFQLDYGVTNSTKMTLDSSGNLGLGVTPSLWNSGYKATQIKNISTFTASLDANFGSNVFVNSAGNYAYIANGVASIYTQNVGTHIWQYAPSGTANNEITGANAFVQAMSLDASGNLLLGGTSTAQLDGAFGQIIGSSSKTTAAIALETQYGAYMMYTDSTDSLIFWDSGDNAPRARITAGGDFLVAKTTSDSTVVGCELRPGGGINSTRSGSTNATSTMEVYSTGAGAYRFYVAMDGTVSATNTTISAISDARLKENVRDLDVGLDAILALKPRTFDWKESKGKNIKDDRGWIAQEFEQVFPDLIDTWKDPAPEGEEPYKSVRADLIPVLVKAMQEQQAMIETLKAKVTALEAK
jgi:hypothetical protein